MSTGFGRLDAVRFIGQVVSYCQFWFQVETSSGRRVSVQKLCLDWDDEAQTFVRNVCPYRTAGLKGQINYVSNGILRSLQDQIPLTLPAHTEFERTARDVEGSKAYWKEHGSESWTPVRILRIPVGLAVRIQSGCVRSGYDLAHPKYGRDLLIKFDREETPDKMYDLRVKEEDRIDAGGASYLQYPLDIVTPETLAKANDEWARLQPMLIRDPRRREPAFQ